MSELEPEQSYSSVEEARLVEYVKMQRKKLMQEVNEFEGGLATVIQEVNKVEGVLAKLCKGLQNKIGKLNRKNKDQLKEVDQIARELQNLERSSARTDESSSGNNCVLQKNVTRLTVEMKELLKKIGQFKMENKVATHYRKNQEHMEMVAHLTRKLKNVVQRSGWTEESLLAHNCGLHNEVIQITEEMKALLKEMSQFTKEKKKILKIVAKYKRAMKQRIVLRKTKESIENRWAQITEALSYSICENFACQTEEGMENEENVVPDTAED